MAKVKILLQGEGEIDNAFIHLEDPEKEREIALDQVSSTKWEKNNVEVFLNGDLDYCLNVQAYFGTKYKCTITREDQKIVEIEGKTNIESISVKENSKPFKDA